jgi:hypothetical protein
MGETIPAKSSLIQGVILQQRSHGAIHQQDALSGKFFDS